MLEDRIATIRDNSFVYFLNRRTGEEISRVDLHEWIGFLQGPPLLAVTWGINSPESELVRLSEDGTVLHRRTVPRVSSVRVIGDVAAVGSDKEDTDADDTLTGFDLATLQPLWSEKSYTFNTQVIGGRLYIGNISWSKGAKALDPRTGVAKVTIPEREPFAQGGSEEFDLQVVTSKWTGYWDPYTATCNGLRRNDSTTAKTKWRIDLPFHVSGTLRDGKRLFVAGSRDSAHRYLVALDWETGKIEKAWSGVPYMDRLIRSGDLILGFDLGKELVAIRID